MEETVSPLGGWESFYVIIGSSAAALTGLQFVVIALVTETRQRTSTNTVDAFATPTIVHFCAVLLVAAVLSAPWPTLVGAALALGRHSTAALFMAAATSVLLLFIGIHNAWDTVTYVALDRLGAGEDQEGG